MLFAIVLSSSFFVSFDILRFLFILKSKKELFTYKEILED